MKSLISFAAGFGALAVFCAAAAHDNDDIVTKSVDLEGFDRIDISGVYDLDVRVGPDFSIELSGPDYEMERVQASLRGNVLELDQRDRERGDKRRWRNKRKGVNAVVTLPSLVGLDVSGVVEGAISGISAETFELEISGVGDMELDGECGSLRAEVSGVGDLDADAFECRSVHIAVSGVGDASVYAREAVEARVSGMGDIDVYGSPPKVSKSDSMFADVTIH